MPQIVLSIKTNYDRRRMKRMVNRARKHIQKVRAKGIIVTEPKIEVLNTPYPDSLEVFLQYRSGFPGQLFKGWMSLKIGDVRCYVERVQ